MPPRTRQSISCLLPINLDSLSCSIVKMERRNSFSYLFHKSFGQTSNFYGLAICKTWGRECLLATLLGSVPSGSAGMDGIEYVPLPGMGYHRTGFPYWLALRTGYQVLVIQKGSAGLLLSPGI